jgi:arylsulfatase
MKRFATVLANIQLVLIGTLIPTSAQTKKPNILVIWGDDIGIHNISAYNLGVMGYRTPNIDRLAKEGALFTDDIEAAFRTWAKNFRERLDEAHGS